MSDHPLKRGVLEQVHHWATGCIGRTHMMTAPALCRYVSGRRPPNHCSDLYDAWCRWRDAGFPEGEDGESCECV